MYSIYAYDDDSGYVVLYQGSSLPDRYPVEEATLSEALNASPVLTFSIYDGHPALAALLRLIGAPGVYENSPTIVVLNESADDEQVFSGRIYSHQFDDVTGKHTFVCEGLLSRLNDYPVAPYSYSGTVAGYLQALFNHSEAALTVGNVTVADANDYITRASETPVNLWDEIADKCIGSSLGGYIEIRDGYIVDWLAAPSASTATQDIEKGINLLGLDVEEQPRAKFSGVLIYGAEAGWENQYGQTMYYNLYQYHDWESSLPSGYTMGSYILWNDALREEIGDRVEILHYPDITQPLNLMRRAVSFLQNQADVQTIQVSAIDMVDAGYGEGIDNIKCGQVIHITGKTVDDDRMVTAITRDLLDPSNTTFEFGGSDSISGSGGSGGSGGGGSMASPHFWHTALEDSETETGRSITGFSTEPLEDVITDVANRRSTVSGGAVWLNSATLAQWSMYYGNLEARVNQASIRVSEALRPTTVTPTTSNLLMMGGSASLGAAGTSANASINANGLSGSVNISATNAVNVSVDTNITGNLDIQGGGTSSHSDTIDTDQSNSNVSSNTYYPATGWMDRDGRYFAFIQAAAFTNGTTRLSLVARNLVNNSTRTDSYLTLDMLKDGTKKATFNGNVDIAGTITAPVSAAVTTLSDVLTQTSTQAANWPITAVRFQTWGSIAALSITVTPTAAKSANYTNTLGTIIAGKRPCVQAGGAGTYLRGGIATGGSVALCAAQAMTANTAYTIGFMYLLA